MLRPTALSMCAAAFLSLTPALAFSADVGTLFPQLSGKWHGRVPGVYDVWVDATPYRAARPWSLWRANVKIQEGSETIELVLELSRNNSTALGVRDAYFLKATDVAAGTSEIHTLSPDVGGTIAGFWRHYEEQSGTSLFTSATGLKLGLERGQLIFAYFSGQGYCTDAGKTTLCASDSYRPFFLDKER